MSLFEKRSTISRRDLRQSLSRAKGGGKFNRQQRVDMEKEVFGKKLGGSISQKDFGRTIRDLEKTKYGGSRQERLEIERKIQLLRDLEKAA